MRFKRPLLTAAILASVLTSASCIEWFGMEQGMVVIEQAVPVQTTPCTTTLGTALARGVFDVSGGARPYTVGLQVLTNLPATLNTQQITRARTQQPSYPNYGNADSNTVAFQEMEVFFTDGDNVGTALEALPSETSIQKLPASGVIYNTQQNIGNQGLVINTVLTGANAEELIGGRIGFDLGNGETKEIVAHITLNGVTTGGGFVQSSEFSLPILLCDGCLVPDCPAGEVAQPAQCAVPFQDVPFECVAQ